ncbi:hypothetical protein MED297_06459 [Reinekea sp. MED297]|uniref:Uncharacterized protein n=1 Tax=Reinekea blandensis MED297 TaxID=314283 RepID=A4BJM0_9GAMM|nr:hypothetical protein MED297_06459 [Reinekea sp. MED297] [Reinekea blandensis MED297]
MKPTMTVRMVLRLPIMSNTNLRVLSNLEMKSTGNRQMRETMFIDRPRLEKGFEQQVTHAVQAHTHFIDSGRGYRVSVACYVNRRPLNIVNKTSS